MLPWSDVVCLPVQLHCATCFPAFPVFFWTFIKDCCLFIPCLLIPYSSLRSSRSWHLLLPSMKFACRILPQHKKQVMLFDFNDIRNCATYQCCILNLNRNVDEIWEREQKWRWSVNNLSVSNRLSVIGLQEIWNVAYKSYWLLLWWFFFSLSLFDT